MILTVLLVKIKVFWWRYCVSLKHQSTVYMAEHFQKLQLNAHACYCRDLVIFYSSINQYNFLFFCDTLFVCKTLLFLHICYIF